MSVPVIDLKDKTPLDAVEEISAACKDVGFLLFVNHPLQQYTEKMFEISKEFFKNETTENKLSCAITPDNKGYSTVGQEKLDPKADIPGDLKEAFNVGLIHGNPPKASQALSPILQQKIDELVDFQHKCHEFCQDLLRAFARGLKLGDDDFFASKHQFEPTNSSILRFLRYPATQENPVRASQHSDYGSLTLLFQQTLPGSGGLQILPPNEAISESEGKWVDVPVIKDSMVVNIGDLTEFWTGRLYKSTLHRVVVPEGRENPAQETSPDRYSVVFFNHPTEATKIYPVIKPSDISQNDLERLERKGVKLDSTPTALEHLKMRLNATYSY